MITLVQINKVAAEQRLEKRINYAQNVAAYQPHQLVFVDESAFDHCTMYQNTVWALSGKRAVCKSFFFCRKK